MTYRTAAVAPMLLNPRQYKSNAMSPDEESCQTRWP
jgi:hypothetical protein